MVTKKTKIRDWYTTAESYKDDELGKELDGEITFSKLIQGMRKGRDVYDLIGVGDSIVRERIFSALSELYAKGDYGEIYNLWLHGKYNISRLAECCGISSPTIAF